MKIVFGAVIYQKGLLYLDEFIDSINNQTYDNFDVLLINDDIVSDITIKDIVNKIRMHVCIIDKQKDGYLYETRIQLMLEAKKRNYDLLVIGDFDDVFSSNRVEMISLNYSNEYSFYYNNIVDFHGATIFGDLPDYMNDITEIIEKNFLGMSNTAINLRKVANDTIESLRNGSMDFFDWYLYTKLLLKEHKGKFVNGCATIYRIYNENIAGAPSDTKYIKEIEVKIHHYSLLSADSPMFEMLHAKYKELLDSIKRGHCQPFAFEVNNSYWWGNFNLLDNESKKIRIIKEQV